MTAAPVLESPSPASPRLDADADQRRSRIPDWAVALAVATAVGLAALIPLAFNRWFYFYADTSEAAYGQWYALGQHLMQGQWPLLEVDAWRAGNWVAEGQWGLWNPLVLAIGVFVFLSPSALLAASLIKIAFLAFGAAGTYLLTRHYGARAGWAVLAAVSAPFAGFTLFQDATSWVTNLMVWAFFPWVFLTARRFALRRRGLLGLLVAGYLLVTIGYVQGTIMTVLLFVALLVEMALRRDRAAVIRTLLPGVVLGLVAVAVYLPGVLTAPVTSRSSVISNDGFMVYTLTALATGSTPSALGDLLGWWGRFPAVPYTYIAWFLPLLALTNFRVLRRLTVAFSGALVFLSLALAYSMAPSLVGPLQFPARTVPWVALMIIVLACVVLSRLRVPRIGRRWSVVLSLWLMGTYLAVAQTPDRWRMHLVLGAGTLAALLISLWLLDRRQRPRAGFASAPVAMAGITVVVLAVQSAVFANVLHSQIDYPDAAQEYRDSLAWGKGDGMVIGKVAITDEEALQESLVGNFWYLSDTRVHNLYSPVQFRLYSEDLCMAHDGITCADAMTTLVSVDPATQVPVIDLLSLDTVQIAATPEWPLEELTGIDPPAGWSVAEIGEVSVTWTRDSAPEAPGGVVWASPGAAVDTLDNSDTHLTLRVEQVPDGGGTVVLSRLAWPGYSIAGAAFADPVRGYLLTVDLTGVSPGDVITVSFQPPGWTVVIASLVAAGVLAIALLIVYGLPRRPRNGVRTDLPGAVDRVG